MHGTCENFSLFNVFLRFGSVCLRAKFWWALVNGDLAYSAQYEAALSYKGDPAHYKLNPCFARSDADAKLTA